jgi:hypothetical protein
MKILKRILPYITVLCLTLILRLFKTSEVPNGFYVDEAAIGYNAYSLLLTGRDEFGQRLPVFLRSFGAYSSPLYIYLTAIPIKLWGLSIFSTRFISLLSGILEVGIFYLILKKLFIFKNNSVYFIATLLFAVSPWTVFFSRAAFEASLALLLSSVAVLLLLIWADEHNSKNPVSLWTGLVLFGLASYSYQAYRLSILILVAGFLFLSIKKVKSNIGNVIIGLILLFLVLLPQILLLTTQAFGFRAAGLFYSEEVRTRFSDIEPKSIGNIIFIFALIREFLSQLFAYFSPKNLFLNGDPDLQRSIPEMSVLYFWLVVPYFIGIYEAIKRRNEFVIKFVLLLLISFVTPAALTKDPFSTLRAYGMVIPILLIIGMGMDNLLTSNKKITYVSLCLLIPFSLLLFWRSYFILFPHERAQYWGYGTSSIAEFVKKKSDKNFILDTGRVKPLYIQLAFFLKIDPVYFQRESSKKIGSNYYSFNDFDPHYKLENFETREIDWENDIYQDQILIGDDLAISPEQVKEHYLRKVIEIKDPMDQTIFAGYETDPQEKCRRTNYFNEKCLKYKK